MQMMLSHADNSKGQLKIQEMAFVLVAIFVFFGLAALFFITVNIGSVKQNVQEINRDVAREAAYQLASTPEFKWRDGSCSGCIDMLKTIIVKQEKGIYIQLWNLDYLRIETIHPEKEGECSLANYPACNSITLANSSAYFGTPSSAFVSLCRDEKIETGGSYEKCELGRIYASVGQDNG